MNNDDDLIKAIYLFIKEFANPQLADDCIIFAKQNNISLPNSDYCVFDIVDLVQHGKPVELYDGNSETVTIKDRTELNVKIDFYSSLKAGGAGMSAFTRAVNINLVSRSYLACKFLEPFGLSLIGSTSPVDSTIVRENNYLRRYSLTLSLLTTREFTVNFEFFDKVQKVIKNVDVLKELF